VLQAFVDESELSDFGVFAVAGFLWDEKHAVRFDRDWRHGLSSYGIADRFHMNEYDNRKGEFAKWPEGKRVRRLQRLHNIINRTMSVGRWAVLDLKAFDALPRQKQKELGGPYSVCVQVFMGRMARYLAEAKHAEPISYVLDQRQGTGHLNTVFSHFAADETTKARYRLGSIVWDDSRCAVHLQAADMLAYEASKYSATSLGRQDRAIRKSFEALVAHRPDDYKGITIGSELLDQLVRGTEVVG